jgi:hypothetical protein
METVQKLKFPSYRPINDPNGSVQYDDESGGNEFKAPTILPFHHRGGDPIVTLNEGVFGFPPPSSVLSGTNYGADLVELFRFDPLIYSHIIIDFILTNRNIDAVNNPYQGQVYRGFKSKLRRLSLVSSPTPTVGILGENMNGYFVLEESEIETINIPNVNFPGGVANPDQWVPSYFSTTSALPFMHMIYDSDQQMTKFQVWAMPETSIKGIAKLM